MVHLPPAEVASAWPNRHVHSIAKTAKTIPLDGAHHYHYGQRPARETSAGIRAARKRGAGMPDLEFDLAKTYEENVACFQQHMTALDPCMAEILFKHLDKLLAGDDPGNRANRTAFNRAVLADLEAPAPAGGGSS